ncbi:MAG TPA: thiamine pyrophosphate-dependent dehydrogenase E1 component subunit alpha [Chloroflexota bacterium]|nr:thiamine pyrophosphate-dependent dehydrogenase E1 component subunit alpha [Chloroflexota bacterium]
MPGPLSDDDLREMHRLMVLSRVFDQAMCQLSNNWFPAEGEEATVIGTFYGLSPEDYLAPHYRGTHVVYHMRGAELWRLACQALGKADSYTGGRGFAHGGPADMGLLPWLGGDIGPQIAQATGAALAFKYKKQPNVVVNAFGDGMSTRGDFHEALNLAGIHKLPIVYVVHNNQWAISTHSTRFLANTNIVEHAHAYSLYGEQFDGNDVLATHEAVSGAIEKARAGQPCLLESLTWRVKGHWAGDRTEYRDAMGDVMQPRPDPIPRFEEQLERRGVLKAADLQRHWQQAKEQTEQAMEKAQAAASADVVGIGLDKVFKPRDEVPA